jgi:uncharacterized cupredoxin-like copper-binding protein
MWGYGASGAWLWPVIVVLAAAGAGVIALVLARTRRPGPAQAGAAPEILAERLARGDIDQGEYRQRLAALSSGPPEHPPGRWRHAAPVAVIAAAAVVALASFMVAAAATRPSPGRSGALAAAPACTVPSLPGHVVDVTLQDMGGGYDPGGMMGGYYPGGMMGGYNPGGWAAGRGGWMRMMRITASPGSVPAGEVSFVARNAGSIAHELVILPLPPGGAGTRPIGPGGTVSERGSLGEASATCAAGAGRGITPGGAGWVTVHLAPGRYELICNRPGHYAMGMFTELDVTGA